jgi:Reverse transcriptase (RNA-dependent DNA polymerase)
LADTGSDYSAIPRNSVEDAKKRGFPVKVEVLLEPIILNMATRGGSDKQKCSATEMLMSAVTITTSSRTLCKHGVRQIIVEKVIDHPLIERPVLDEMDFMASQHLDSVRDKLHLHDFSHIGEELFETGRKPLGALSKLLLMPVKIPEFIEDLPDVLTLAKKKNKKRRKQTKPNALDEDQCELQLIEVDNGDHDVLKPNVKLASLKEQAFFYGDIPDDDPIDFHDVDVGQGSPEELADAIECFITSAERAVMSRNGSEVFATLDFCQGYWQIPLHKDSQACQYFITPDGVYTPTSVLHGTSNATQHLQSVLIAMMDEIKSNIKVWLDDCLLHTKMEDDLLATLNDFFKQCQEHELKLHASKCVLFATTVRYCGRFITKDGVRFDPKNMEELQTMQEPQDGADLVQYVAAVKWMRSAIPNYSKRVALLQEALAKVFECKSHRTVKTAATVSLLHL